MKHKLSFLLIFAAIFGNIAFAQNSNYSELTKRYSSKYFAGPVLMYDCHAKHWVCTDEDALRECEQSRELALSSNDEVLPCAYFKTFDDIRSCVNKNLSLVSDPRSMRFCYHPKVFDRTILFN